MFGLDTNEKELKELLAHMGCEASVFKNFKTKYEKLDKRHEQNVSRYNSVRESGMQVLQLLEKVETYFSENASVDLQGAAKELKKLKGSYVHVFLVSEQDREFASTYDTLINKLPLLEKKQENHLLIQSEVENLLAMIREDMDHQKPNLRAYSYFLVDHKDMELEEMSADKKCEYILGLYQNEVINPVSHAVEKAVASNSSAAAFTGRFHQLFHEMTK